MESAIILLSLHLMTAAVVIYDLIYRSKRNSKVSWAFAILILPILGVLIYHGTKKRNRHPSWR